MTPFNRSLTVRKVQPIADSNAGKQRKARKQMTQLELECGITLEQYQQIHAEQRARVLARYGKAA